MALPSLTLRVLTKAVADRSTWNQRLAANGRHLKERLHLSFCPPGTGIVPDTPGEAAGHAVVPVSRAHRARFLLRKKEWVG